MISTKPQGDTGVAPAMHFMKFILKSCVAIHFVEIMNFIEICLKSAVLESFLHETMQFHEISSTYMVVDEST